MIGTPSSPNIIQVIKSGRMRWKGHVVCMEGMINVCRVLVKQQEKTPLRKPKCRWEDETKDLKEIGWGGGCMDWIHLSQDSYLLVSCYEHSNQPSVFIMHGEFLDLLRKYWLVIKDCCMQALIIIIIFSSVGPLAFSNFTMPVSFLDIPHLFCL